MVAQKEEGPGALHLDAPPAERHLTRSGSTASGMVACTTGKVSWGSSLSILRITPNALSESGRGGRDRRLQVLQAGDNLCVPPTTHTRVDLHFHVLPGVDDGPATLEHSLRIARLAVRDGTRLAVATPHVRSDHLLSVDQLHERVRALQHELDRERIELRLLPGAELGHEMVACLSDGELQTIAQGSPGRRWILLEAPFDGLTEDFHEAADELRTRGFGVLMAHPERMAGIAADDDRALARELKRGTLLQVNSWSLAGAHGEQVRALAAAFVALPEAVAIASDAHADWREPLLGLGVEGAVRAGLKRPVAAGLCSAAALALLHRGLQPSRSASAA